VPGEAPDVAAKDQEKLVHFAAVTASGRTNRMPDASFAYRGLDAENTMRHFGDDGRLRRAANPDRSLPLSSSIMH
jgi:hypothetical protein